MYIVKVGGGEAVNLAKDALDVQVGLGHGLAVGAGVEVGVGGGGAVGGIGGASGAVRRGRARGGRNERSMTAFDLPAISTPPSASRCRES